MRSIFSILFLSIVHTVVGAKTCLFKVSDGSHWIYLLGSVHVLRAFDYPLPEAMENAYAVSERVIFELHPDSAESPAAQMQIFQAGSLPSGATLRTILSDSIYTRLSSYAEALGFNLDFAQRMKPWMVGTLLTLSKMAQKGILPEFGVDRFFSQRASADGKAVLGLETVSFQLSLFDSLCFEDPDAFFTYLFKEWESIDGSLDRILHTWREGDLEGLSHLLIDSFAESPRLYQTLVVARNRAWIDRILASAADGRPTLVIVGAAHLAGPEGLLALFHARGFQIESL